MFQPSVAPSAHYDHKNPLIKTESIFFDPVRHLISRFYGKHMDEGHPAGFLIRGRVQRAGPSA
jgi:hypothetical protein